MSAAWVAGSVRARALGRRRLGAERTRQLASCGSLGDALRILAATAYGPNLKPEQSLAKAQHEIAGGVLWDLRVLAGWLPGEGVRLLRVLGAWFEMANIDELLQSIAGRPAVDAVPAPRNSGPVDSPARAGPSRGDIGPGGAGAGGRRPATPGRHLWPAPRTCVS